MRKLIHSQKMAKVYRECFACQAFRGGFEDSWEYIERMIEYHPELKIDMKGANAASTAAA